MNTQTKGIILIVCSNLFIIFINILFIIYSKKNYILLLRYPLLLFFVTLGICIFCTSCLLEIFFNESINHLVYFNLKNISLIICFSLYIYRGFIIYFDYVFNKNKLLNINHNIIIKNKKTKNIIILYNLIYTMYIIFININYHNKPFIKTDWQYYPLIVTEFIYIIIFNPIIIYYLNNIKSNIKIEYIISMIFLLISNLSFIIINYKFIQYKIINSCLVFISTYIICIIYNLPFVFNNKIILILI